MATKSGKTYLSSEIALMPQPITFEHLKLKLYMPNAWLTTFKSTPNTKLSNFAPKTLYYPNEQAVQY